MHAVLAPHQLSWTSRQQPSNCVQDLMNPWSPRICGGLSSCQPRWGENAFCYLSLLLGAPFFHEHLLSGRDTGVCRKNKPQTSRSSCPYWGTGKLWVPWWGVWLTQHRRAPKEISTPTAPRQSANLKGTLWTKGWGGDRQDPGREPDDKHKESGEGQRFQLQSLPSTDTLWSSLFYCLKHVRAFCLTTPASQTTWNILFPQSQLP